MRFLLLIPFCCAQFVLQAQGKFEWFEDQCLKIGYFDTSQVTYNQIQQIYYSFLLDSPIHSKFIANNPTEITQLDLDALHKEYSENKAAVEKMSIPPVPYWKAYQSDRIIWLFKEFELKKQLIQAYTNPKILHTKGGCEKYAIPLIKGGKTLLSSWGDLNIELMKDAQDPLLLEREFLQKQKSKDRKLWARIEVLNFGWWNCASAYLNNHFDEKSRWVEFEKLFSRIENGCTK